MSTYSSCPEVIATDLGDELILLDPRNGEMFGLNACGRRVWFALAKSSVERLAEMLCAEFVVSPTRVRADVASLLDALTDAGLVVREG